MKNPAGRKLAPLYYLIPVIYVGVIVLFLLLQFSARESFQEKVGNLLVSGSLSRRGLFGSGDIASAAVAFNDLVFDFDKRNPLLLRDRKLALRSYSLFAEGAELSFAEGVILRFSLTGRLGDRLELTARLPRDRDGTGFIELPFRVEEGTRRGYPGLPLLDAENGAGRFFVSLPRGSVVGEERLALALTPDSGSARLLIERRGPEAGDPYLYWFGHNLPTGAAAVLPERRREFQERAYRTWQLKPLASYESLARAEAAGAALFSEALKRGDYRRILVTYARNIRTLLSRSPGEIFPRATSPYLGSLALFLEARQADAARSVREVTRLMTRGDLNLFLTPALIPLVLNHGPFSVVEEAVRLAEGADLRSASGELLLGLLETLLEAQRWIGDSPGLERQALAIINTRLLPAVEARGDELFLRLSAPEPADVLLSLSAGKLIAEAGELLAAEELAAIGRSLTSSALSLADETGSLPRTWTPGDAASPAAAADRLPPEAVYALASEAAYLPREYALYRVLNPGTYIWSAAGIIEPRAEADRQRFSFSFPVGEAHYLLIQGIPLFTSLVMHEIPWNPDPQYFSYTDGWYYEQETQTLFVKITHRRQEEEIVLSY
jgi:hypothetical protein